MKQISWYRSIRFRIPAVIALVLLVPIVVFWHYSMELTRKNMLSQTSNLIYTNLYGASLLMDDVMEQVSDFSREISQDPGFLSLISQYQQADAGSDQRQKARSQLSLALSQYVGQLRTLDSIYLMFPETETVVTMLPGQKELSFSHHYAQQLYQMYYDVFESPIVWHLLPSAGGGSRMLSHIRPVSGSCPAGKVHPDLQSEGLRLADRSFRSGAVLRFCLDQQLCRTGAPLLWEHAFHVPEHWPRQPLFPGFCAKPPVWDLLLPGGWHRLSDLLL